MSSGEELVSPNGHYSLIMQGDGNLVLYEGTVACPTSSCSGDALWNSGTEGDDGDYVTMQSDGNLVIYDNGTAVWNSNTAGHTGSLLKLQDDNNLVIYQGGTALWDWRSGDLSGGGGAGNEGQAIVAAAQAVQSQSYPAQSFSTAKFLYCFDGGTTSGASPGKGDPDPIGGSYSNCNSIGRTGFDCRGLVLYAVYQGSGGAVSLVSESATAQTQYSEASSYGGSYISLSSVQPGGLVFFGSSASDVEHVGIVVSGAGSSALILSAIDEGDGITDTVSGQPTTVGWFEGGSDGFAWAAAVAIPGV